MMLNLFLSLSFFSHLGSQVHEMNVGLNPVLNSNLALYINEERESAKVFYLLLYSIPLTTLLLSPLKLH